MIATVLLAVSVMAISGAITASYSQDQYARDRRAALASGAQLLDEVTALPIDSANSGNPSIMQYSTFTDQATVGNLTSVVSGVSNPVSTASAKKATRKVSVKRMASLSGVDNATGDFAVVGVEVDNGGEAITVNRLVTAAEANATR
jgi:Tfp pilus assembly protein PilV